MTVSSLAATGSAWRFCLLTPRGRGAIATIAVRGSGAVAAIGRRFRTLGGKEMADYAVGRASYGRFRSLDTADEDVVIGILRDDELEIHCHGGEAAARAIADALTCEGGQ